MTDACDALRMYFCCSINAPETIKAMHFQGYSILSEHIKSYNLGLQFGVKLKNNTLLTYVLLFKDVYLILN